MFNLNELFIPTDYDLTVWTDVDNLLYKNKAEFQAYTTKLENGYYEQYFDFTEKSSTTNEPMNANYSIIVDRIKLYLLSLDETDLDVILDGDLKNWKIRVDEETMLITYYGDYVDPNKSIKEKVYIINIKEYDSELTKYKEFRYCVDNFKNKYDQVIFMSYEKFVDVVEQRLSVEETDKDEANAIIKQFQDDFKNNQGTTPDDKWKQAICVIDSYKTPMIEIIDDDLYVIPVDENNDIDYSLLNDRLKEICLKEQNKY